VKCCRVASGCAVGVGVAANTRFTALGATPSKMVAIALSGRSHITCHCCHVCVRDGPGETKLSEVGHAQAGLESFQFSVCS
jgi:methyl coenzyme M reductase subunit C